MSSDWKIAQLSRLTLPCFSNFHEAVRSAAVPGSLPRHTSLMANNFDVSDEFLSPWQPRDCSILSKTGLNYATAPRRSGGDVI